jgi:hypothetical protein
MPTRDAIEAHSLARGDATLLEQATRISLVERTQWKAVKPVLLQPATDGTFPTTTTRPTGAGSTGTSVWRSHVSMSLKTS